MLLAVGTKAPSHPANRHASESLSRSATLELQLDSLEQKWFAILHAEFADKSLPPSASGEIQFFSTDFPRTYVAPHNDQTALPSTGSGSALCVVCVGVSHNTYRHRGEGNKFTPHIYTRSRGETWAVEFRRTRSTRRALNTTLAGYAMNRQAWMENGYASHDRLLPSTWDGREAEFPLVVIKTYLSPFIFTKPWSEYSGTVRTETLDGWNPNRHMCDFIQTLGDKVDLWVIQGNHVWPHFNTNSQEITNWILAPSLTYASQRNGAIATFWKTPRQNMPLSGPFFPSC
jgi:hypothetical protein